MTANHFIKLGVTRPVTPDNTPVYYQGRVVGRVVSSLQDEIKIEVDEQHREAVMEHFKDVSMGPES